MKLWKTLHDSSGLVMLLGMALAVTIWIVTGSDQELPKDALRRELKDTACVWWAKHDICVCSVSGSWGFIASPAVCDLEDE